MKNRLYSNLFAVVLVLLFVFIALFALISNANIAFAENQKVQDFINTYKIKADVVNKKNLLDFNGNKYELYEFGENGYAIFESSSGIMLEGSKSATSPYYKYEDSNLYYLGIGNYYILIDDKLLDVKRNVFVECYDNLKKNNVSVPINQQYYSSNSKLYKRNQLKYAGDDFTYINNHGYFEDLDQYPINNDNSCGVTALSILLGYYDCYHNDGFVDDFYMYKETLHVTSLSQASGWYPSSGTLNSFGSFIKNSSYIHYVPNVSGAYPMTHIEIKNTIDDYIYGECPSYINDNYHHSYGTIVNTHSYPRYLLSINWPVILTLTMYEYAGNTYWTNWHDVVAYGYNEARDEFVVHMGWGHSTNDYILSTYTVMGYYALIYTGEHDHSSNNYVMHHYKFLGRDYVSTLGVCGCGVKTIISIDRE